MLKEVNAMTKTDVLHIRIDPERKRRVDRTLKVLGLTMTDAVNIFLGQVDLTGGIPFDVRLPAPKPELVEALVEARRIGMKEMEGKEFSSAEERPQEI
jgi:DNA-damage-inducible protein J